MDDHLFTPKQGTCPKFEEKILKSQARNFLSRYSPVKVAQPQSESDKKRQEKKAVDTKNL